MESDIKEIEQRYVAGGHSDVWKAKIAWNGVDVVVAVKVLRRFGKTPEVLQLLFKREVTIWKKLDHRNLAPLYRVYSQWNGSPAMVQPWYPHGTASDYLRQHPSADHIGIIMGVADGLAYMHDKHVVHGDIKGINVMVDHDFKARLIDFGNAKSMDEGLNAEEFACIWEGFSIRWCAPELLTPGAVSTPSSDVYAFASTVLELVSGQVPYNTVLERLLAPMVRSGMAPSVRSGDLFFERLSGDIWRALRLWVVLASCWAEASRRPSMREIQLTLRRIYF